jgi:hypothetical protein
LATAQAAKMETAKPHTSDSMCAASDMMATLRGVVARQGRGEA